MVILKILMSILFFFGIISSSIAQDLSGKWYMINRSGLIEMKLSEDSIFNRKLFTDLTPKNDEVRSNKIVKTEHLQDRILIITPSTKDTSVFSAMTIINYSDSRYFQVSRNVTDTTFKSIDSLIKFHSQGEKKLYGYYVFSEDFLDSLNSLKNIEEMPLEDFKMFAREYVERIKMTKSEFEKYNIGYAALTYNSQLITQSLFAVGYNPLESTRTIEPLFKKYFEDPEVQSILKEVRN